MFHHLDNDEFTTERKVLRGYSCNTGQTWSVSFVGLIVTIYSVCISMLYIL